MRSTLKSLAYDALDNVILSQAFQLGAVLIATDNAFSRMFPCRLYIDDILLVTLDASEPTSTSAANLPAASVLTVCLTAEAITARWSSVIEIAIILSADDSV